MIFHSNYYTTHNEHVIRFFVVYIYGVVHSRCSQPSTNAKHRQNSREKILFINYQSFIMTRSHYKARYFVFVVFLIRVFRCFWGRSKKKTQLLWCVPFDRLITIALWRFAKTHDVSIYRVAASGEMNDYIIRVCSRYAILLSTKLEWTQYNKNIVLQKCV